MRSMPIPKTKFRPPVLRQPIVPRPRLTGVFSDRCPLIVVSAPAGSGKTTLVLEWLASSKSRVAWFSLDSDDNDPMRFIHGCLGALQTAGETLQIPAGQQHLRLMMAEIINQLSDTDPITPLLITKHFQGGAGQLAWWLSSFSVGTILGGLILGAWGGFRRKIVTAQLGLILTGFSTMIVGVAPSHLFWVGLAANTMVGLLLPIINGSYGATLQATIVPEMQGRAFAFIMSAAMLVSPLALMIAGPFADRFGIQLWFLIAGLSCMLMGILGFFSSDVMSMEKERTKQRERVLREPS